MLMQNANAEREMSPSANGDAALSPQLLKAELDFYRDYPWCLNALPAIRDVVEHLRRELRRLDEGLENWQRAEVATNVFLLSCAVASSVDDYLNGEVYDFSKAAERLPILRPAVAGVASVLAASKKLRALRLERWHRWGRDWKSAVDRFLERFVAGAPKDPGGISDLLARLSSLLAVELPADLQNSSAKIPAAFRSQDLTHFDVLKLGEKLCSHRDETGPPGQPILVVGLRTAGSYFAPLLCAYLRTKGYREVDYVTLRPKKGIASWEAAQLEGAARRRSLAVIVDEPVGTGSTVTQAAEIARKTGFAGTDIVALLPVHRSQRDWKKLFDRLAPAGVTVLRLEPEESHKHQLYKTHAVERRLREYFSARKYVTMKMVEGETVDELNARLQSLSEEGFHSRLKRIYQARLQTSDGRSETRYVLAKSVGWGWFGYHAFLAADRLSRFIPPVLGLRDGILYMEWLPQGRTHGGGEPDRESVVPQLSSYISARARSMRLEHDPSRAMNRENEHNGFRQLAGVLSKAYGQNALGVLKRGRIRSWLSSYAPSLPTLTDGQMRRLEWISDASSLRKTDFEHHGMGKHQLNVTDPVYDLAEAILHWDLSEDEEGELVARYVAESGDSNVEQRLFLNKLLSGTSAMGRAYESLTDPRLVQRSQEFHRQYLQAWNFLTLQTMRFCARLCHRPQVRGGRGPLVVLDVDGVLDRQIFGFHSTSLAGIQAVSMLNAHDIPIILNTARSISQVREYCKAYGFRGGIAEYGSVVWDAETGRERVLVSREAIGQLKEAIRCLREIPGVFLDDGYRHSLRAYTYQHDTTGPLPTLVVQNLIAARGLDHLTFHKTFTDTAILSREVDKGKGLMEFLTWTGRRDVETVAVGDSASDLPMFRAASRSFAPAHIGCRAAALALGCRIAARAYQPGLLEIARWIAHASGGRCERCRRPDRASEYSGLFVRLLGVADQSLLARSLALLDPLVLEAFKK
jgi:hydroxymethylpyrimidine pyrophosphatase-like HAD family hydrolase